jgi:hypothetical protein
MFDRSPLASLAIAFALAASCAGLGYVLAPEVVAEVVAYWRAK